MREKVKNLAKNYALFQIILCLIWCFISSLKKDDADIQCYASTSSYYPLTQQQISNSTDSINVSQVFNDISDSNFYFASFQSGIIWASFFLVLLDQSKIDEFENACENLIYLWFYINLFYGQAKMIYLCYSRLNHYGKVCSGDFLGYQNYKGFDSDQQLYYKMASEFNQGKYLYAMTLMAIVFLAIVFFTLLASIFEIIKDSLKSNSKKNKNLDDDEKYERKDKEYESESPLRKGDDDEKYEKKYKEYESPQKEEESPKKAYE